MYRLWGLIRKNNKRVKDMIAQSTEPGLTEEARLEQCIQQMCSAYDLQRPMWLPKNVRDYETYKRVVLNQDNFIEFIDFDALELEVLED